MFSSFFKCYFMIALLILTLFSCKHEQININADNYKKLEIAENINIINAYNLKGGDLGWVNLVSILPVVGKKRISSRFYYEYNQNINEGIISGTYMVHDSNKCVYFTVATTNDFPVRVFYGSTFYDCAKEQSSDNKYYMKNLNLDNYFFHSTPIIEDTIEYLKSEGFIYKESIYKDGNDIMIKDDNENYFKIIEVHRSSYNANYIDGLMFKLYSKSKSIF